MSSGRRGRRGRTTRKSENVADIHQKWLQVLERISANLEPELCLNKALSELSQLPLQTITRSFKEIESDLLMIGGHLSLAGYVGMEQSVQLSTADDNLQIDACSAFCRILTKLLSRPNASLSGSGFRDLIRLVLQWTEQSLDTDTVNQSMVDSLRALGAILSAFPSQISVHTQSSLEHIFTTALTRHCYKPPNSPYSREAGRINLSVELCCAASDAVQALFSNRNDVQPQSVDKMMDVVANILHRQKPTENPFLSGMYISLLHALTALVSEGRGSHVSRVPALMEAVPGFLGVGAQPTSSVASFSDSLSDVSSDGSNSMYVPPHRRVSDGSGYTSASSSNISGSETSGCGGIIRSSDQHKTVKIRLAALNLVQKMTQVDGRSLHPYWRVLLPFRQPLQRSPSSPHLISVLLYDPHPQARMAAAGTIATLLEGRTQKGFLSVAEISDRDSFAIRGFTTLSLSLGRMVLALHDGLLHGIENEEKLSVIPHLFRTLNSLVSSTRYDRMPSDLRTRMVKSIQKQWTRYHENGDGDVARETACMIAIRTILGSSPTDPVLEEYLADTSGSGHNQGKLSQRVHSFLKERRPGWSLLDALFAVAYSHRDVVRSEALAALTCAATNYSHLFKERWNDVATLLNKNIIQRPLEHSGSEEKSAQQSIRLFGALTANHTLMEDEQLLEHAIAIVPKHIIPSFAHPSPVLRSAALAEIGGAAQAVLMSLPQPVLQKCLAAALNAAVEDPVVAVRSSACRMIGDLVNAGYFLSNKEMYDQAVSVLATSLENPTISVRISSSWSLANVADLIARHPTTLPSISRDAVSLKPLAQAAIAASRDHEKVRANGIRALGHLLRETHFSDSQACDGWLNDAVDCLQSSLQTSSAKVKWNACYATGSLASNTSLKSTVCTSGALSDLIGHLVHLVNENPNFKVQMQAAAALDNISARSAFKDMFFPAISAVARRLHILQDGSQDLQEEQQSDNELIRPTVDASFPNFKYHEGLKNQLETTLMHLLSLLDAPFSDVCVFPRPDILFTWLKRRVDDVCESQADANTAAEWRHRLPSVLHSLSKHEGHLADWISLLSRLNP